MLSEMAERVRAIGTELTPEAIEASRLLFLDQHEIEPYRDVRVVRDAPYGPDARNRLDVFTRAAEGARLPVLAFVHGGGFVMGDKRMPGSPYNDNVALFAARNGMVGVNLTYRLAPTHRWPSGAEDMREAVAWMRREIGRYGGDPRRIVLMGTSAGASHVASYVAFGAYHAAPGTGLAGAILLSGVYDFTTDQPNARHIAYLGDDASLYAARSSVDGLIATQLRILYVLAEHDPDLFVRQTLAILNRTVERTGRLPPFVHLLGHNHLTASQHLNTADDYLGRQIAAFVARLEPAG